MRVSAGQGLPPPCCSLPATAVPPEIDEADVLCCDSVKKEEKDQRVNRNKYEGSRCKTARDNSLPSWACLIREKFRVPDVKDFSFYLFLLCIFCAKLWKNRNN